jgi:3-oxoacyl-[acyl-carrier-protein] synthase-1
VYITTVGMICPVGLTAPSACAAMRAGIASFAELPYHDNYGEPVTGAIVPDLAAGMRHEARLVELLAVVLCDPTADRGKDSWIDMPLLVGLAESNRPGGGAELTGTIVRRVEERLDAYFHPTLSRTVVQGHTAGFVLLKIARDILADQRVSGCLVVGVDSYINARSLQWLDQNARLKTPENSDGVIPGEGAAAVLVRREPPSGTTTRVAGLGFAEEAAHVLSDDPLLGIGLAAAARAALAEAGAAMHEVDFRLSDVTGESYGFKEQALALARLLRARREDMPLWHAADSIGDTGAAAGVVQLIVAAQAFARGYAPGRRVMACTSAVPGQRAVAVLERAEQSSISPRP